MEQAQEYAIGWGSLALINAGLAQGKNRSGAELVFSFALARPRCHVSLGGSL